MTAVAVDTDVAPPEQTSGRRYLTALGSALAPAGVYLAVRLVGVATLGWLAAHNGSTLSNRLQAWDGQWLLAIAANGYAGVSSNLRDAYNNVTPETPLVFFPGFPGAVSIGGWFTGGDLLLSGLVVSVLSGVAAAYALTRLGELVRGGSRRAGLLLTGLFAATPMSIVLSMTYTEALFCALAAWSLVAVLRRQWLLAGAMCAVAGLVRPTASSLVLALGAAAIASIVQRRDGLRPWLGGLLATTGLLGYLGFVATRTGSPDGWFTLQRAGWGTYLDGGSATVHYMVGVLEGGDTVLDLTTVAALIGVLVLLTVAVAMRLPWPLVVYGAAVALTVWGSAGIMNSKLRLLIPAFTLLLPMALGLSRRRPATAVAVLITTALASAWFGGYALTIWRYGI